VKNVLTNTPQIHYFDNILIANGHYHTPKYAYIPNAHLFKGEYLHSRDYRTSDIFDGKSRYFTINFDYLSVNIPFKFKYF